MDAHFAWVLFHRGEIEKSRAAWDRAAKGFRCTRYFHEAGCCVCGKIAISLARGDLDTAEQDFKAAIQEGSFGGSGVSMMIDRIIRGLQNDDASLLELGQNDWIVDYLRPDITDILRSLRTRTPPTEVADEDIENAEVVPMEIRWLSGEEKASFWEGRLSPNSSLSSDEDLELAEFAGSAVPSLPIPQDA
jgi:hypothetical protein